MPYTQLLGTLGLLEEEKKKDGLQKMDIVFRDGLGENMPYASTGYLGTGYDLTEGNPNGNGDSLLDPGYRAPVIKLNWSQETRHSTRDMQKLTPTQAYGIPKVACQHATTATRQTTMDDYIDELNTDVAVTESKSVGFAVFSGSSNFAKSDGVNRFRQSVENAKSERFEMKSYCIQYEQTMMSPANRLDTLPYFNERVAQLPAWPMIIDNDCATNFCSNLFFPKLQLFIEVKDKKLVLVKKAPVTGRWLFTSMWSQVAWVRKDKNWIIDESTLFLTRANDGSLSMKPRITLSDTSSIASQQWTYKVEDERLYSSKGNNKHLYLGWDEKKHKAGAVPELKVFGENEAAFAQDILRNHVNVADQDPWNKFFAEFGTHFVQSVTLGGRMVTTVTLTESDVKKIEKDGVSATEAVGASFGIDGKSLEKASPFLSTVKGQSSNEEKNTRDTKKEAVNAVFNSRTDAKTFVLGGDPPEDPSQEAQHGFGEWAKTVGHNSPQSLTLNLTLTLQYLVKHESDHKPNYNATHHHHHHTHARTHTHTTEI